MNFYGLFEEDFEEDFSFENVLKPVEIQLKFDDFNLKNIQKEFNTNLDLLQNNLQRSELKRLSTKKSNQKELYGVLNLINCPVEDIRNLEHDNPNKTMLLNQTCIFKIIVGTPNQISQLQSAIEHISHRASITLDFTIDWNEISNQVNNKSAIDCKIRWYHLFHYIRFNVDHPNVNTSNWTLEETENLQNYVNENPYNWLQIAGKCGNGRIPANCFRMYKHLQTYKIPFTPEQDSMLIESYEKYGDNWKIIESMVIGKTAEQCAHRYKKCLVPGIKKGKWSKSEDRILFAAVNKHGKKWNKVSEEVPNRTGPQCRERYFNSNVGSKNIITGQFSNEEDETLLELVQKNGKSWSKIAQDMNRNDNQCLQRYKKLQAGQQQ